MKTKILLCFLAVTMVTTVQSLNAQVVGAPNVGGYSGGQVYEPGAFQPVVGELHTGMPGRVWVGASLADEGLGYQGSYATIGMKRRFFEDFMDGRWLGEARFHQSLNNNGGFFANIGIERVFSLDSAGAEVGLDDRGAQRGRRDRGGGARLRRDHHAFRQLALGLGDQEIAQRRVVLDAELDPLQLLGRRRRLVRVVEQDAGVEHLVGALQVPRVERGERAHGVRDHAVHLHQLVGDALDLAQGLRTLQAAQERPALAHPA